MTNIIRIPVPISATYIADGGRKEKIETFLKDMEFEIKEDNNLDRVFYMKMTYGSEYEVLKKDDKLFYPISGEIIRPGGYAFSPKEILGVTIEDLEMMIRQKINHNLNYDNKKSYSMDLYNNLLANTLNYADKDPIVLGENLIRQKPEKVKEWTGSNENYLLNKIQKIFDGFILYNGYLISETGFPKTAFSQRTAGALMSFSSHPLGSREKVVNHSIFTSSNKDYDHIEEYEFKEDEYYNLVTIDFIIENINKKITDILKDKNIWNEDNVFYDFVNLKNAIEDFHKNQDKLYFINTVKEILNKESFFSFCEGDRLFQDINIDLNSMEKLLSNPEYKTNISHGYKM